MRTIRNPKKETGHLENMSGWRKLSMSFVFNRCWSIFKMFNFFAGREQGGRCSCFSSLYIFLHKTYFLCQFLNLMTVTFFYKYKYFVSQRQLLDFLSFLDLFCTKNKVSYFVSLNHWPDKIKSQKNNNITGMLKKELYMTVSCWYLFFFYYINKKITHKSYGTSSWV